MARSLGSKDQDPLDRKDFAQHDGWLSDVELAGLIMSMSQVSIDLARKIVDYVRYNYEAPGLWDEVLASRDIRYVSYGAWEQTVDRLSRRRRRLRA